MEQRTINIQQACNLMQVSRRTVYNWMDAGKVQFVRTPSGARRIIEATLWREGNVRPDPQKQA